MTENRDRLQQSELVESRIRHSCSSPLSATSRNWLEVGDIMTEDIASVCPGASVVSAAKIMSDKNISCIIVSDNGDLSGIITETDLLKKGGRCAERLWNVQCAGQEAQKARETISCIRKGPWAFEYFHENAADKRRLHAEPFFHSHHSLGTGRASA